MALVRYHSDFGHYHLFRRKVRTLRIEMDAMRVKVIAPMNMAINQIEEFVHQQKKWIQRQIEARQQLDRQSARFWPQQLDPQAQIPFWGQLWPVEIQYQDQGPLSIEFEQGFKLKGKAKIFQEDEQRELFGAMGQWFVHHAHQHAQRSVDQWAHRLGQMPAGIQIKAQRSRWGSCGQRNVLHINRCLVFAPQDVFEYVVCHEMCHLVYRHHGPRFWGLVQSLMPDYREKEIQLNKKGNLWLSVHNRFFEG